MNTEIQLAASHVNRHPAEFILTLGEIGNRHGCSGKIAYCQQILDLLPSQLSQMSHDQRVLESEVIGQLKLLHTRREQNKGELAVPPPDRHPIEYLNLDLVADDIVATHISFAKGRDFVEQCVPGAIDQLRPKIEARIREELATHSLPSSRVLILEACFAEVREDGQEAGD